MNLSIENNNSQIEDLTYEQAFMELEVLVQALENEEHSLDTAMALFERGQALARHCTQLLEQAELKIQTITQQGLSDYQPQE